eukprot:scaffold26896_cov44-Cyclotella_meneghiniana.AAC.3
MSEPTEKWAGAGDDPNGNRVSSTPMSSPLGVGQMAMHFDAILGVVNDIAVFVDGQLVLETDGVDFGVFKLRNAVDGDGDTVT